MADRKVSNKTKKRSATHTAITIITIIIAIILMHQKMNELF